MALARRTYAALMKGRDHAGILGILVIGYAVYGLLVGIGPEPQIMGVIGTLAVVVNIAVALMLLRFWVRDANMRSAWICSRNEAIGNIAVSAGKLSVFLTGQAWPPTC